MTFEIYINYTQYDNLLIIYQKLEKVMNKNKQTRKKYTLNPVTQASLLNLKFILYICTLTQKYFNVLQRKSMNVKGK